MSDPTPISEIFEGQRKQTRCGACGAEYEQTVYQGRWWPSFHAQCRPQGAERKPERREDEEQERKLRLIRIDELRARQRNALNIPPLYRDVTLSNFDTATEAQRAVLTRATAYAFNFRERDENPTAFPQVVLMLGPPGTGKGHIAWSIAKEVSEDLDPYSVQVAKCSDIIRDLRQSWGGQDGVSEVSRLKHYRDLQLLVIDEVSRHALYGEPSRHLYDLIDHRQEWLRPTIITSNEDENGIAELLGPALVSRAAGWSGVWSFDGDDYRVRSRKLRNAE